MSSKALYDRFKRRGSRERGDSGRRRWADFVWSITDSDEAVLAFTADQVILDTFLIANVST